MYLPHLVTLSFFQFLLYITLCKFVLLTWCEIDKYCNTYGFPFWKKTTRVFIVLHYIDLDCVFWCHCRWPTRWWQPANCTSWVTLLNVCGRWTDNLCCKNCRTVVPCIDSIRLPSTEQKRKLNKILMRGTLSFQRCTSLASLKHSANVWKRWLSDLY